LTTNESNILDLLKKSDEELEKGIDWKSSLDDACKVAADCQDILMEIFFIIAYRKREKKEGYKRISSVNLRQKINKDRVTMFKQYHSEFNITDQVILDWLKAILHPVFSLPDNLQTDIFPGINSAIALQSAFRILANDPLKSPLLRSMFVLNKQYTDLLLKTIKLRKKIDEEERLGDQNSQNASTTSLKINKIKLSDQYPKLKQVLNKFDGSAEEKAAIDRILKKILNLGDGKTLRKYRQYLLDNFDHEKQDIN
jgi:hypothetical protein